MCQHGKGVGHKWCRPAKYETQCEWVASVCWQAQNTQTNFNGAPNRDKETSKGTEKECARTPWGWDTCGYRLGKFESELVVFGMRKAHRDKFRFRRTDGGLKGSWTGPDSCSGNTKTNGWLFPRHHQLTPLFHQTEQFAQF